MILTSCGLKHQGKKRQHNEDSFLTADELGLYAVADGVESEPYGEIASQTAVESLQKIITNMDQDADATPPFEYAEGIPLPARAMKFAIREVNRVIYDKAGSDQKYRGMSTTLTALWFKEGRAFIGNVGDSRAYIIRGGQIQQLTRDHTSLAQGSASQTVRIDFMEDYSAVSEHELTRALGLNRDIDVQLAGGTPKPGDIFMICTDGLYEDVRDFEMLDAVKAYAPDNAAKELIRLANDRGGKDNVAVVVVKIS